MNRHDFLKGLFRTFLLVIMGGLTGFLVRKGKITRSSECDLFFQCANCGKSKKCTLQEAKTFREND